MNKFKYENTVKQQADVICYAFSDELLDASESELRSFLKVLSKHFPKTENGEGGFKPMENQIFLNTYNNAHANVCKLIEEKRTKKRHCQLFLVSVFTLAVLIATLANTVYVQSSTGAHQQSTEALNKSIQSTPAATAD